MKFEKVSLETFKKDLEKNGFSWMTENEIEQAWQGIKKPQRKTRFSAGYDISTPVNFHILPKDKVVVPTGIKAYFSPEEAEAWHLQLFIRSSIGISKGVVMSNQTGIIDADYYGNEADEGDMLIALTNTNNHLVKFNAGERIIQGIFALHGITVNDHAEGKRIGGVGSTNKS